MPGYAQVNVLNHAQLSFACKTTGSVLVTVVVAIDGFQLIQFEMTKRCLEQHALSDFNVGLANYDGGSGATVVYKGIVTPIFDQNFGDNYVVAEDNDYQDVFYMWTDDGTTKPFAVKEVIYDEGLMFVNFTYLTQPAIAGAQGTTNGIIVTYRCNTPDEVGSGVVSISLDVGADHNGIAFSWVKQCNVYDEWQYNEGVAVFFFVMVFMATNFAIMVHTLLCFSCVLFAFFLALLFFCKSTTVLCSQLLFERGVLRRCQNSVLVSLLFIPILHNRIVSYLAVLGSAIP